MADIEEKLDILIKAYMQDRERLLALPLVSENSTYSNKYKNPPPPPPPASAIASTLASSNSTVRPIFHCTNYQHKISFIIIKNKLIVLAETNIDKKTVF